MQMKGYKILDCDFTCRNKQYQVGETYHEDGPIQLCGQGMHFCEKAINCLGHYGLTQQNRYAEVEASDQIQSDQTKSVTNTLKIIREISYSEFAEMCTGILQTSYPSGQILISVPLIKGKPSGLFQKWHSNGLIAETVHFKNGQKQGVAECTGWAHNEQFWISDRDQPLIEDPGDIIHQVTSRMNYVDGKKEGLFESWHITGNREIRCHYINGKKHGLYEHWTHTDGKLKDEYYIMGHLAHEAGYLKYLALKH
jgi:hypothetical protein